MLDRIGDFINNYGNETKEYEQEPEADAKVYTDAEINALVKSMNLSGMAPEKSVVKSRNEIKPVARNNGSADFKSKFLHDFTVIDVLGEGSFGSVFKAENQYDCCKYAVKRIAVRTKNKRQLDRALREVRVMSQLDHPHIVRYNSTWMEEPLLAVRSRRGNPEMHAVTKTAIGELTPQGYDGDCAFIYIQMQLCHTSLEQWLKDSQDPASRDLSSMKLWFKQIVSAVAYIHSKKLLHRDLKPSNILIADDGRLKVCDLGIASAQRLENGMEVVVTRTYKSWTELYRSPEQNSYLPRYSSKTDVFTLGLILAEMCCVMSRDERAQVFNCYRAGAKTDLNIAPSTAEFITWMTKVDPDCRPTCSEMLSNEFLSGIHSPLCCH